MEVEDSLITQIMVHLVNTGIYTPIQQTTIREKLISRYSNYLIDFFEIIKGRIFIPFNEIVKIIDMMQNTEITDATSARPFKHRNTDEFVCARLNDIDTHDGLKMALFSDAGKTAVISSLNNDHGNVTAVTAESLSFYTIRFISFLMYFQDGEVRVFKIKTHEISAQHRGFLVSRIDPEEETIMLLAKRAAREYITIGIMEQVCIHYDIYYDRSSAQGGLFHRDSLAGDIVKTRYVSLEYFINPVVIGGISKPGVLLGPEIVGYVDEEDKLEFGYGENVVDFSTTQSLRVLVLDGNIVILNNKNIHATPAIVGHMPPNTPYRFIDSRRIDLQSQQGVSLYGNRSIAMQSIGQTRSFIRGWITDTTHINIDTQTLILSVPAYGDLIRNLDETDIVGGGIKLNEFRLTGIPCKIVFKDEPIITDLDVIKKMISNEMTQIMSLIIFSVIKNRYIKASRQKSFTKPIHMIRKLRTKSVTLRQKQKPRTKSDTLRQKPFTKPIPITRTSRRSSQIRRHRNK